MPPNDAICNFSRTGLMEAGFHLSSQIGVRLLYRGKGIRCGCEGIGDHAPSEKTLIDKGKVHNRMLLNITVVDLIGGDGAIPLMYTTPIPPQVRLYYSTIFRECQQ